jgi:hypothetical protein
MTTRECKTCGKVKPIDAYKVDAMYRGRYRRHVCQACRKRAEGQRERRQAAYHREQRATPLGQLVARKHKARARVAYWQEVEAEMDRKIAEMSHLSTPAPRPGG